MIKSAHYVPRYKWEYQGLMKHYFGHKSKCKVRKYFVYKSLSEGENIQ